MADSFLSFGSLVFLARDFFGAFDVVGLLVFFADMKFSLRLVVLVGSPQRRRPCMTTQLPLKARDIQR